MRDPILESQKGVVIFDKRGRVIGEVFSLPPRTKKIHKRSNQKDNRRNRVSNREKRS